jgi:8-oxo-dGTP pyrophosphatase MutT (NUDIX family)
VTHGACAIFFRDGRVLLGRRSPAKRFYPERWDLIGGHMEPGETAEQALVRECREEFGVTPTRFAPLGHMTVPEDSPIVGATYHIFQVADWTGGEPRLLGDEHTDVRWFTVEEACALEGLALAGYRALFQGLT